MQQARLLPALLLTLLLTLTLAACGGGSSAPVPPATPPAAPAATLTLSAAASTVTTGGKEVALNANVSDASAISWQLAAGNPGTLSVSAGASNSYLPPAGGISADTSITITASAGGVSKSLTLTLSPAPVIAADAPQLQLIAGEDGGPGAIDGIGTRARLEGTYAMAFDRAGNLYLSDVTDYYSGWGGNYPETVTYNDPDRSNIRKVTPGGLVTTVLDTPSQSVDGPAATAQISRPYSMAFGADQSLYWVESGALRKRDQAGNISTLLTITNDRIKLTADRAGKLYALNAHTISSVSASGVLTPIAGQDDGATAPADGSGSMARFLNLVDAAADADGNLYLIDGASLRKMSPAGQVSTIAGVATDKELAAQDGSGSAAHFALPRSIAVTAAGTILVVDRRDASGSASLLRSVTPAGVVTSVPLAHDGRLLTSPSGALLLAKDFAIETLAMDGSTKPFVGKNRQLASVDGSGPAARFFSPILLGRDQSGNLYVVDGTTPIERGAFDPQPLGFSVRKVTPAGVVTTLASATDIGTPSGIAIAGDGTIYLSVHVPSTLAHGSMYYGGAIYQLKPGGAITLLTGQTGPATDLTDGGSTTATFRWPYLLGISANGNLYVNDKALSYSDIIRKVNPDGTVSTVSALPADVKTTVADQSGNTYSVVQDPFSIWMGNATADHVVYKTTPGGVKTVVAGTLGQRGTLDGALPGHLLHPSGLVQTGPYSFALISYGAIMQLVVPH
jgi:hypothetical protein